MVSYGERPPLLHELRAGLEQAAAEAGPLTEKGRWFLARRDALPGTDLPDDPGCLPIDIQSPRYAPRGAGHQLERGYRWNRYPVRATASPCGSSFRTRREPSGRS